MSFTLASCALFKQQAYHSGQWLDAKDKKTFDVTNPATGDVLGTCPALTEEDVENAISAAQEAFRIWSAQTAAHRATVLKRWHGLILAHKEDLARIMTSEQGKPITESRIEVDISAAYVEWFAEEARRVYGDVIPSPVGGRQTLVTKHPVGVAAAITPWNFPASMFTRKLAPALAAGCAMIVRPSERTPFVALAFAALAEEAGLPPGVFSVLTGSSRRIVKVITDSQTVRKISFTGSTEVGKSLIKQSADTVKRMSMELGGNAPILIFDDCDIEAAITGLMALKFRNAGQTCVCANRIFVQNSIRDEVVTRFAESAAALKLGDGHDEDTEIGPLITPDAAQKMHEIVQDAVKAGARIVTGGQMGCDTVAPNEKTAFYQPTVLTDVTPTMDVARNEIFGPIAPVLGFDTEEEAIALANDTQYGLASYIYTQDLGRAWRVSDALEYGMVGVNEVAISNEVAPFGGIKESGFGREGSKYGIDEYLDIKYRCMGGLAKPA
ncbi:NAD-dependent succinate-semialdehyde dehydrogenase [Celeribacter sp.]|uniref:NAD-dependent succinate-semialdehyde dehydrogenase n=1 Tax=Celeribacter sp. TaxID=1890673 RepID=UPI003A939104